MRRVVRRVLQRDRNDAFHVLIADRARGAGARRIDQAVHAEIQETPTPLAHRRPVDAERLGDIPIAPSLGASENDAGAEGVRLRGLWTPGPAAEFGTLFIGQCQRGEWSAHGV